MTTYKFTIHGSGTETFIPPHTTRFAGFNVEAETKEIAWEQAQAMIPEGASILCWMDISTTVSEE